MTIGRSVCVLLLLLSTQWIAGCGDVPATTPGTATTGTPQSLPTTRLAIGGETFELEIADDDAERATGLMHRTSMPADRGMLFVFPDERRRSFWMKNTHLPLDILYLDAAGRVVSIKPMRPFNLDGVDSEKPARFAIELNRGAAGRAGAAVGNVISVPAEIIAAAR